MKIDPLLYRPADIQDIYGSSEKAHWVLNWTYDMDFFAVLDHLLEEEASNYVKK
jgi:GDPmannose 4,6-dehydratase